MFRRGARPVAPRPTSVRDVVGIDPSSGEPKSAAMRSFDHAVRPLGSGRRRGRHPVRAERREFAGKRIEASRRDRRTTRRDRRPTARRDRHPAIPIPRTTRRSSSGSPKGFPSRLRPPRRLQSLALRDAASTTRPSSPSSGSPGFPPGIAIGVASPARNHERLQGQRRFRVARSVGRGPPRASRRPMRRSSPLPRSREGGQWGGRRRQRCRPATRRRTIGSIGVIRTTNARDLPAAPARPCHPVSGFRDSLPGADTMAGPTGERRRTRPRAPLPLARPLLPTGRPGRFPPGVPPRRGRIRQGPPPPGVDREPGPWPSNFALIATPGTPSSRASPN
jgi:hypothetical protein